MQNLVLYCDGLWVQNLLLKQWKFGGGLTRWLANLLLQRAPPQDKTVTTLARLGKMRPSQQQAMLLVLKG